MIGHVIVLSLILPIIPIVIIKKGGIMSTEARQIPWLLYLVFVVIGAGLAVILIVAEGDAGAMTPAGWAAVIIGFAPLIGAQLALGIPSAAQKVQAWLQATRRPLLHTGVGVTAIWLVVQLLSGEFDPYMTVVVGLGLVAALGALRQVERGQRGLTWVDMAVWLLLWIPFDLRWIYDLGGDYNWWSIAISVIAVIGWYGLRDLPDFGYRLVPRWRDIVIAVVATAVFAAIVIPIGLAIDFLTWPPSQPPQLVPALLMFVGIFLTVAIPEELFFRGILLHGLDQMTQRRWLTLLGVAFFFGLMHWNNVDDLTTQIAYTALATLAGIFYGWAYRRSGNNILAAAITHALVDVIWATFLQ